MRYDTPRITQDSDWRIKVLWALFLPVLALAIALFFYYGEGAEDLQSIAEESAQVSQIQALEKERLALEAERETLRKRVALLERSSQIDREAALQLSGELKSEQEERLKLVNELALLKRIVSSSVTTEGLYVQGFRWVNDRLQIVFATDSLSVRH